MAPPKSDDENLSFLFSCFQNAVKNGGKVDYKVVAAAHGINTGAASMRLTRIKKALGSHTEQNEVDNGENTPVGASLKSPKTPKSKANKADLVGALNTNDDEEAISTPTPVAEGNGKKRKLDEAEQDDGVNQRAGIKKESLA